MSKNSRVYKGVFDLFYQDDDDVNPVETTGPARPVAPLNALNDTINDKVKHKRNSHKSNELRINTYASQNVRKQDFSQSANLSHSPSPRL